MPKKLIAVETPSAAGLWHCAACGAKSLELTTRGACQCPRCKRQYWEGSLVALPSGSTAEPKTDPVNHPKHYTSDPSGVECITITRHRNFNVGNAIKYLWRAGLKDEAKHIQDLEKAVWYIQDEIKRLKGEK